MKIIQINTVSGKGSTGKICVNISKKMVCENIQNYILYCTGEDSYFLAKKYCATSVKFEALCSRIKGNYGFNSKLMTKRIIKELEYYKPDIVHLHNLHGHNCNLEILFNYLKKNKIQILWTFHDCWAFTAYCPYYDMIECDKWKTECNKCALWRKFSWFIDRSQWIFNRKRILFSGLKLTIVTPSKWLEKQVKESYLKEYPVKVIHNGIDLSKFYPRKNTFRKKHGISTSVNILLGVAYVWEKRKGADVFVELSKRLSNEKYCIVLVGRKKQSTEFDNSIIWIQQTANQDELAEIYSMADLFINPTREENYPTVNMEALACGTPVVTFRTGGSPEMLNEKVGSVVERDDIDALEKEIIRICEEKPYSREDCVKHAKNFDMNARYMEYVELYKELL